MNMNEFTQKSQEAILAAKSVAEEYGNPEIQPEHLLLALIEQDEGIVPRVLQRMNVDVRSMRNAAQDAVEELPRVSGGTQASVGRRLNRVLDHAQKARGEFNDEYVSTEHLLLGLIRGGGGKTDRILQGAGVREDAVMQALRDRSGT